MSVDPGDRQGRQFSAYVRPPCSMVLEPARRALGLRGRARKRSRQGRAQPAREGRLAGAARPARFQQARSGQAAIPPWFW